MRALRNHLVLFVTIGLALGVLPAVASAHVAQAARPAAHQAAAELPVTLKLSTDSIKIGHTFGATGTVTDVPMGTKVRLQRGTSGTWTTVATTQTTSAAGAFALKAVTATETGAFLYRAVAGSGTSLTSDYTWMFVAAKHPATIVSGYVQAGGPVAGSSVLVYLKNRTKPIRTTTSPNGYFLVRLPALPKSLLVVATGGSGPIGKFKGTMTALVSNPNTDDSFYINPATTLVAAYMTLHPKATHATAWTKIRTLLGLEKYHNLDWALGGRPSYFDSVKFLRTARKHGGFDKYVGHLVGQIDHDRAPVSFRRTGDAAAPATSAEQLRNGSQGAAIAGLIGEDAAGYLGVAAQGASVINASLGLMNLVGSLVGWSPSGGPTPAQMLGAIDQVESTLTAIQTQIADLDALVKQGIADLEAKVDGAAFTLTVASLNTASQLVETTQGQYANYVSDQEIVARCVPPPPVTTPPTPAVALADCSFTDPVTNQPYSLTAQQINTVLLTTLPGDLEAYAGSVGKLEAMIGNTTDYFHDSILPNGASTPALSYFVDMYLDSTGNMFLPYGSYLAYNFTSKVLTHQAWAYYLSMAYERSAHPVVVQGGTADQTSIAYLGLDYADMPQFDPTANPLDTAVPAGGNLSEEMTYLQAILPVPTGAAVDANPGGLMYLSTDNVGLASMFLPADAASRADCIALVTFNGGKACQALTDPLTDLNVYMSIFPEIQGWQWASSEPGPQSGPPGTYSNGLTTGWGLVSQGDLGTMLPRLAGVQDVNAEYYYNPGPVNYGGGDDIYWVLSSDGSTLCTDPYVDPNSACAGESEGISDGYGVPYVLDWLKLYFKLLDGSDFTCTWAVGQANTNSDPCFDMPALIARPLLSGEDYVPQ